MYQQVTIVGRLGGDPVLKYTQDGTPVTSFGVATDKRWKDANGEQQQKTVWFRCTCWRALAETCSQYLSKGKLVLVVGSLSEPRVYQAKDGEHRASLDLRADTVKFLSPRSETTDKSDEPYEPEAGEESIPF